MTIMHAYGIDNRLMYMRTLGLFLVSLMMVGCAQLSPIQQEVLLEEVAVDASYQYEALPVGMQGDPDLSDHVIELPAGKSFYKGYSLPKPHGRFAIQLRTYLDRTPVGDGFFYPVVEIRDFNKKIIDIVRPQLRFTQLSPQGRYAAIPIELNPDVGFIVIRTEPKLYGQEASYTTAHQGASWSYSVSPFTKRKPASYLHLGSLELLTPDEGFSRPFEKMSGPYWQFSWGRGGEKLVSGTDIFPSMNLGGGPIMSLGYAWGISGRPSSVIRSSLGLGFYAVEDSDGDMHTQYFAASDLLWVESNQVSSLGIGLDVRAGHVYENDGVEAKFDPAWGPKVIVEIRGAMGVSLGAYMSWLTFTDEQGEEFGSNQFGLYLSRLY